VLKHFDGSFCYIVEKSIAEASGHELNSASSGAGRALCHESVDWMRRKRWTFSDHVTLRTGSWI
jgi:hypothetical protein